MTQEDDTQKNSNESSTPQENTPSKELTQANSQPQPETPEVSPDPDNSPEPAENIAQKTKAPSEEIHTLPVEDIYEESPKRNKWVSILGVAAVGTLLVTGGIKMGIFDFSITPKQSKKSLAKHNRSNPSSHTNHTETTTPQASHQQHQPLPLQEPLHTQELAETLTQELATPHTPAPVEELAIEELDAPLEELHELAPPSMHSTPLPPTSHESSFLAFYQNSEPLPKKEVVTKALAPSAAPQEEPSQTLISSLPDNEEEPTVDLTFPLFEKPSNTEASTETNEEPSPENLQAFHIEEDSALFTLEEAVELEDSPSTDMPSAPITPAHSEETHTASDLQSFDELQSLEDSIESHSDAIALKTEAIQTSLNETSPEPQEPEFTEDDFFFASLDHDFTEETTEPIQEESSLSDPDVLITQAEEEFTLDELTSEEPSQPEADVVAHLDEEIFLDDLPSEVTPKEPSQPEATEVAITNEDATTESLEAELPEEELFSSEEDRFFAELDLELLASEELPSTQDEILIAETPEATPEPLVEENDIFIAQLDEELSLPEDNFTEEHEGILIASTDNEAPFTFDTFEDTPSEELSETTTPTEEATEEHEEILIASTDDETLFTFEAFEDTPAQESAETTTPTEEATEEHEGILIAANDDEALFTFDAFEDDPTQELDETSSPTEEFIPEAATEEEILISNTETSSDPTYIEPFFPGILEPTSNIKTTPVATSEATSEEVTIQSPASTEAPKETLTANSPEPEIFLDSTLENAVEKPKHLPQVRAVIHALHISSVAQKGTKSRMFANGRTYRVGDLISKNPEVRWSDINPSKKRIYFTDLNGLKYMKRY